MLVSAIMVHERVQCWYRPSWLRKGSSVGIGHHGSGKGPVLVSAIMAQERVQCRYRPSWFMKGSSVGIGHHDSGKGPV